MFLQSVNDDVLVNVEQNALHICKVTDEWHLDCGGFSLAEFTTEENAKEAFEIVVQEIENEERERVEHNICNVIRLKRLFKAMAIKYVKFGG